MMQKRPRGRPRKNPPLNADEILESLKAKKKPTVLARDSQPSAREAGCIPYISDQIDSE